MTTPRSSSLFEQLAEMPAFFEKVYGKLSTAVLTRAPEEDNLSLIEHLWHTRDCESELYQPRIQQALNETSPRLISLPDIGSWPQARAYLARDAAQGVSEFGALRRQLITQLQTLEPAQFERVAIGRDEQAYSVYDLIEHLADHDRDHRARIGALIARHAV